MASILKMCLDIFLGENLKRVRVRVAGHFPQSFLDGVW